MATGGYDRLSHLPDDLLRRILHFAPLKEAASTAALSRRWRAPLWLSSGAINLETGVDHHARCIYRRDDIVAAATGVLVAVADAPVTRLTLHHNKYNGVPDYVYTDLVDVVLSQVLSHRAARRVEELRLLTRKPSESYHYGYLEGLYQLTLHSLSLETLRILDLTNCKGILYQSQHAVFPRLSSLRLSHCVQNLSSLQRIIDDAPQLASLRLESVLIHKTEVGKKATTRCLRCPTANVLVLDSCTEGYDKKTFHVDEINAPRLRHFRYKGPLRSFSFSPQPLDFEQVDLHFIKQGYDCNQKDPDRDLETFWRFARSFTRTREMRLSVNHLEDIAVVSEPRRVELLPAFRWLERLEVQGLHSMKSTTATVTTILNLLRCCPALSSLRINLTTEEENTSNNKKGVRTRVPWGSGLQIAAMLGPSHFYQCLQSSLGGLGFRFRLQESDCLGDKLIKFSAEKAMVLKEMCIDSGDKKLCDQMNPKIEKWNSNRRKLGATNFVVLPLKSRLYS